MRSACFLIRWFFLAIVLLLSGPAWAQSTKLHMERLNFDSMPDLRVYLTYVEGDGTVITGKTNADFKLLLDSAEQGAAKKLITFDQTKEPIYVMAVVQVSPAMEQVLDEVKKGVKQVAEAVNGISGGKMGLLGYASDAKRLVESGTGGDVQNALSKLIIDSEGTEVHMLDTLRTAMDLLNAQPKGSRKLIVLFSDGIDVNNEKKAFTELGRRAQQSGIVVDTIGYAPFEPGKLKLLTELAKNSYGTERGCKDAGAITTRFSAVVDEIQKQYVATFALPIQGDDKEHGFQVFQEAGGKPAWSDTVNAVVPSSTVRVICEDGSPPPCKKQPSNWWKWLLGILGAMGLGYVIYALTRKQPQPLAAPTPIAAPMLTPGKANKTVALDAAGDIAMAWVMGLTGSVKDKTFKLKARTVIGTAPDCDVAIQDARMSAHHCLILQVQGGFELVDNGSTNGVVVNDKKVQKHFLVDNDTFRLGLTEFRFKAII